MSNQFEKDSHQKYAAALDDKATQWANVGKKVKPNFFVAGTHVLNTATGTDSKCQMSQNSWDYVSLGS